MVGQDWRGHTSHGVHRSKGWWGPTRRMKMKEVAVVVTGIQFPMTMRVAVVSRSVPLIIVEWVSAPFPPKHHSTRASILFSFIIISFFFCFGFSFILCSCLVFQGNINIVHVCLFQVWVFNVFELWSHIWFFRLVWLHARFVRVNFLLIGFFVLMGFKEFDWNLNPHWHWF